MYANAVRVWEIRLLIVTSILRVVCAVEVQAGRSARNESIYISRECLSGPICCIVSECQNMHLRDLDVRSVFEICIRTPSEDGGEM